MMLFRLNPSSGHKGRQGAIPAEIAKSLPPYTEWEITVVPDGLHLRYIGTYEPGPRGARPKPAADLPFLDGDEASP